jgi:thioesterase domain-containing protein
MKPSDLQKFIYSQIPQAKALGAQVTRVDASLAEVRAPLALNGNHLGTAFGGSLHSISVLACYSWLFNALDERKLKVHVVVKRSEMKYLFPVLGEIIAICRAPDEAERNRFMQILERKKKAQITLHATVLVGSDTACEFEGEFVAR